MVPGKQFDKPGKSPFMDMQLVPVYAADSDSANPGVKISPTLQQNLGIRLAAVRRVEAPETFELVGSTQFDESQAEIIQSRVTGYIDKLYVRSPQQRVNRGAAVASLFVPEWLAPQEEYLALKRGGDTMLVSAARQRMRTLSIPDALVADLDRTGHAQSHLTLTSPLSGVVTELGIRDGAQVTPGVTIAKVVGTNKIWLIVEIPEATVNSARPGMQVTAVFAGNAERKYRGQVKEILPGVSTSTRTVQARLELDNRDGSLIPGMFMRVQLNSTKRTSRLFVPTEAIIASGGGSVVLVADEQSGMRPVIVTTGRELRDDTEILSGLSQGQKVVASGQFLIDSEANLKSILPKFSSVSAEPQGKSVGPVSASTASMEPIAATTPAKTAEMKVPPQSAVTTYHGVGKVEQVTGEALTLSHSPIPALQWPAMTMDFKKPHPDSFKGISAGQAVEFSFKKGEDGYVLENVVVSPGGKR
jgi:Cu(I)/Ag(I) efflux system membrane fusion protein